MTIVFGMLAGEGDDAPARAAKLGLPILDGLFADGSLTLLDGARLSNRRLMAAVRRLAWLRGDTGLVPVNWRDMETEELGSVYESLLELTPILSDDGRSMTFAVGDETKGNQRKTTGSYYTPDSLVQALLDTALNPVLDRAEREAADPVEGLLGLTVIDPACGSGHFLLAAARRIATRVSRLRGGGVADRLEFRHAMRDVVRRCIHGVDRNPMAIELAKVALWIETVDPGKPLGFLDANMRCGDSLLGVFDRAALIQGVPDAAYKPLTGDDKAAARDLERRNTSEKTAQGELGLNGGANALPPAWPLVEAAALLRSMPEETVQDVAARRRAYGRDFAPGRALISMACDLYVAAFVSPKRPPLDHRWLDRAPTTSDVVLVYEGHALDRDLLSRWTDLAGEARAFHWFLAFPDILERGGFDVVIGNPPWEVMQLGEEEYFAQRLPEVATLKGSARKRAIAALEHDRPDIFSMFEIDKRRFEASNEFTRASGRFDLSARGKVNTYALFAELFSHLINPRGRAGIIVPTGIATDATTAVFFGWLIKNRKLITLIDFENRQALFPNIDRQIKLCLLTIGHDAPVAGFSFFLTNTGQMNERERCFTLNATEISRINPNTHTAPVFRSRADAELTAKIYGRVPVLLNDTQGSEGNPWRMDFRQGLFNMTSDSGLFKDAIQLSAAGLVRRGTTWEQNGGLRPAQGGLALFGGADSLSLPLDGAQDRALERYVPLYEAKMIHQFDHRWATYDGFDSRDTTSAEHSDTNFEPAPRYWVPEREVELRLADKGWNRRWLMGWRDISKVVNERTLIATAYPRLGCGDTLLIMLPGIDDLRRIACLIGNAAALTLDYSTRQKVGGTHLKYNIFKQLPFLAPHSYSNSDLEFIVPRVIELTYTSYSMAPFARDLGYEGRPFEWEEERRALLRAQLDARYARLYGLTRDELRYVLDPSDVRGRDYPSETFRVLKANEIRRFGEYRTARLVLAAWDAEAATMRTAAE